MTAGLEYRLVESWGQRVKGYDYLEVTGVAVDSDDRVYVLTRMPARVLILTAAGSVLGAFGEGQFSERAHGLTIGRHSKAYIVDDGSHAVYILSSDGEVIEVIGTPGVASDTGYDPHRGISFDRVASITRGGRPFNRPTGLAFGPDGEFFVSDGYGNARVHRFSASGLLLQSWGEPGTGPGEFHLPHGLAVTPDGHVAVADRENDRIQFFTRNGEFLQEWVDTQRPTDIFVDSKGLVYISELRRQPDEQSFTRGWPTAELPGRVSIFDSEGTLLARWGGHEVCKPGNFWAPHAICADSRGDVYVGEVGYSYREAGDRGVLPPYCPLIQKFERVPGVGRALG